MVENITGEYITMETTNMLLANSEASLVVTLLCGVASLTIVVIAVMLCAKCKEHKQTENDLELKEVTTVPDQKKKKGNGSKKSKNKKGAEAGDVELDVEDNHRHSNGAAPRHGDNRPKSHDRALPDIPNYGVISTDEEETDVDPGHYDIIGARKRMNSQTKQHAYDKIQGEPDTDSGGYAGIKDPTYSKVKGDNSSIQDVQDPGYAGIGEEADGSSADFVDGKQHPYAMVDNVGEADYAQIAVNVNRRSRLEQGNDTSQSVDTLNNSFLPPVPDRNYGEDQDVDAPMPPQSSPNLPPRNSMDVMGGMAANGSSLQNGASGMGAGDVLADDTGAAAAPVKTGPDYSKLTARISLAELQKWQAVEMTASNIPDNGSATYATVDYDQIKSPGAAGASDRFSLTSDLYAEIANSTSARSSTYARVGELSMPAPIPPPIDTLVGLSHTDDGAEDKLEPGYSQIQRPNHPHSTASSLGPDSVLRSPLYAVVDKNKKRKMVDGEEADNVAAQVNIEAMYSKVNKNKAAGLVAYDNSPGSSQCRNGAMNGSVVGTSSDCDYHTIGSVQDYDPDYAQVQEPMITQPGGSVMATVDDLDSNYEKLADARSQPVSHLPPPVGGSTSMNSGSTGQQPGVAREIANGTMVLAPQPPLEVTWQRREHIYQEISDTEQEAVAQHNQTGSIDTML